MRHDADGHEAGDRLESRIAERAAIRPGELALAVGETVGRLAPGRDADILVVPGDPVADLDVLGRPLDVFLAGRRVRRLAAE